MKLGVSQSKLVSFQLGSHGGVNINLALPIKISRFGVIDPRSVVMQIPGLSLYFLLPTLSFRLYRYDETTANKGDREDLPQSSEQTIGPRKRYASEQLRKPAPNLALWNCR